MTDTISRQATIDAFYLYPNINWTTLDILKKINEIPTIQPEIVRCGECKYCVYHPATPNAKRPCDPPQPERWHCYKNRDFRPRVMPHDFCSRGKRREVNHESN